MKLLSKYANWTLLVLNYETKFKQSVEIFNFNCEIGFNFLQKIVFKYFNLDLGTFKLFPNDLCY